MKLCRIVYEMPPPWDGLAPHPYEVTVAQAKKGYDIDVFCGRWPNAGPLELINGVRFHPIIREPLPGTVNVTSSVILFFNYLGWRKFNRPDILHCHGHFAIWIYLYRLILQKYFPWSRELSIPLVAHFHNTSAGRAESMENAGKPVSLHSKYISWPLSTFSDKLAVKTAAACIFVSVATRDEAIKFYGADPKRCFVVETGVNSERFTPINAGEKEKSRKEMGLDQFDKVILNLGMMVERKNINLLVDALALLPEVYKLELVGLGDAVYLQKVNENIKKNNLNDRVIQVGYTPYPLTPIAYQVADVFVLPSSWEGLPKVVMEALACGIPCLVSGFKIAEQINGVFYLPDLKAETVAKMAKEIIESHPEVDIGKVRVYYSWDERVKQIDKVYEFAAKNYII